MVLKYSVGLLCLAIDQRTNNEIGRTKLQKMIYFASRYLGWQVGNFKLHYYGPYSSSVAGVLHDAKDILISETAPMDRSTYKYDLTDDGQTFLNEFANDVCDEKLLHDTKQMFSALSDWTKNELELCATLDFVQRNTLKVEGTVSPVDKVCKIKENFSRADIEQAYDKLSKWKRENNFQ